MMFRRWWLLVAVSLALVGCGGNTNEPQPQADPMPVLPKQTLLSSSMHQQPVQGWTHTVKDMGLPPGTVVRPVGNIGDRGFFLGITGEGWWLLGLDVTSGQRVFGPLRLGTAGDATNFNCYVNGPPNVLCVRQAPNGGGPSTAWVVDTSSGKLAFEGPTDLMVAGVNDQPRVEQIGDYAIATVMGKGVYGVGARGEFTWFVPGDGILPAQFTRKARDIAMSTLAVQGGGGVHDDVVFSVVDGRVVAPSVPHDVQPARVVVYPGGFGYQYSPVEDPTKERVVFFYETGKKLGEPTLEGKLDNGSLDLPMISAQSSRTVFSLDGRTLLELPPSKPAADARLIGSRYYVATDDVNRVWQQFDLATRKAGKTCEGNTLGYQYIASDGEVAVASGHRG